MKLFVLLSFIAMSFGSFSQEDSWMEFKKSLEKGNLKVKGVKKALKKLKLSYNFNWEQLSDCDIDESLNRDLYPKYKEYEYFFCKKLDSMCCALYHIKFYSYRSKVIFLRLKNAEDTVTELLFISNRFNNLIETHSNSMDINPDTSHYYFNLKQSTKLCFRFNAGRYMFFDAESIDSLVNQNNREELVKWCHSLSPEIRVYGAIGLIRLNQKKNVDLKQEDKRLIEMIRNQNISIQTCFIYGEPKVYYTTKEFIDIETSK